MKELLERFHRSGKHISLYHEADTPDTFSFGTVLCLDDDFVLMQLLSPDGGYDGIALFSLDEIIRIEVDTQYAEKMNTLMESAQMNSLGWQPVVDAVAVVALAFGAVAEFEIGVVYVRPAADGAFVAVGAFGLLTAALAAAGRRSEGTRCAAAVIASVREKIRYVPAEGQHIVQ